MIKRELLSNIKTLQKNSFAIDKELEDINKGLSLVGPLYLLNVEFFILFFINIPEKIKENQSILSQIFDIANLTKENNGIMNSRENYRINNGAMSNMESRMKKYDNIIRENNSHLIMLTEGFLVGIEGKSKK